MLKIMDDAKKKILIVEDETSLSKVLSERFNTEGFEVETAVNGEDGLNKALEIHPDIILLDIILPKIDGMTVLQKLRENEWGKDVPVIILTNLSDAEKIAQAAENRVYDFLVKTDWKLDEVVAKVKDRLGM